MTELPDFPGVRISAGRLDIREFGPADVSLVSEVLQGGEWLPLSTALVGPVEASETGYRADVDWWLADAVHEPRRDGTGLNLMMLAREDDQIVGWIYLTDVGPTSAPLVTSRSALPTPPPSAARSRGRAADGSCCHPAHSAASLWAAVGPRPPSGLIYTLPRARRHR